MGEYDAEFDILTKFAIGGLVLVVVGLAILAWLWH